jgi:hypothetical protein
MINRMPALVAGALLAASLATLTNAAPAAPLSGALAIKNAAPGHAETVGWGGRGWGGGGGWRGGPGWRGPGWGGGGWRGPGWGYGVGAAVVGGAIIGSALARPYYYDYYGPPVVYGPPPVVYYGPPPAVYAPPPPPAYAPPPQLTLPPK